LSKAILENIDVVKVLGITYLGMKGVEFASSAFRVLSIGVAEVTTGLRVLAAVDMAATTASMASVATQGTAAATAFTAVASKGTVVGTVVANLATGFGRLISPVTIAVAGIASLLALLNDLINKLNGVSSEQAKAREEMDRYNNSLEALARGVASGTQALRDEAVVLDQQINLLRQGKSAADAYAQAKLNATLVQADDKFLPIEARFKEAQAKVKRGPVGGGDATAESNEQKRNLRELQDAETEYQKALKERANIASEVTNATAIASANANKKEIVNLETQKNALNDQLADIKKKGDAAKAALAAKTYETGIDPASAAKARERLQKQVALSEKTEGLRSKPLGSDAGTPELQTRKAQLDSLLDNSYEPPKRTFGGGASKATKVRDYSGDLEKSNIASLVERQQEDIKVLELTHKNHLITEEQYQAQLVGVYATWGPRIEEEYSSSIARLAKLQAASSGDQAAQYEKKRKDMETAYRKFQFDEAYRSADSLAAEMGRIKKSGEEIQKVLEEQQANTDQIMERLAATRIKLDLTPEQAAGYDARKAVEKPLDKSIAGKRAEEQNLLNAGYSEESASLKAVRAEIELLIEARARLGGQAAAQAEAEVSFARSYEYGWKSAFRAWTDEGANAAKTAADSFAVMTNGMESLIDNFLTTGKLGFADFAKSVILSIAKIEARAALSQGLKAVGGNGGGGFGGIISGILGAITGGGGGGFSSGDFANLASSFIDSAKGNVFSGSSSLHAYANTVQTSPKTFAFQNLHGFARGGVFAEAGPEAVMPLSRDSRGRLGVKASSEGGPINITVHVNGNSNAPDVRRAAGQGAREALAAFNGARRYA
jgi:lambda family phage tail tape measure protein